MTNGPGRAYVRSRGRREKVHLLHPALVRRPALLIIAAACNESYQKRDELAVVRIQWN